jgi:predicted dehydrogenase
VLFETGALEYHFRAGGRSVEMGAGVNDLIEYPNDGDPVTLSVPADDPYSAEVAYFVDCVKSGQPAMRATPADARLALQVALAAKESLESGGTVPLPRKGEGGA